VQHRSIGNWKRKFKGTDGEWETILCHFLLQKHPEADHARILDHVRVIYTQKKDSLELSIQQDVKGIKVCFAGPGTGPS
jgi:hypothetical protein